MRIEIADGIAEVYTPYNKDFVKRINHISGAKWEPTKKCWKIPEETVPECREIMQDAYGETDLVPCKKVKLKLTFHEDVTAAREDVTLFGKTVCHAWGRDSGGRAGDDVSFIKGKPSSGDSAKNWDSIVPAESVVILYHVPEQLYKEFAGSEKFTVELLPDETYRQKLLEEKERLLKRLAEIEKELESQDCA